MGSLIKQAEPRAGGKRRVAKRALFIGLAATCVFGLAVWGARLTVASRVVRLALDKQGFADASFRLTRLSPGCVVVEEVRLGGASPVLSVDWAEARFSFPEILRGQLDRVRVRGVETAVVFEAGKPQSPLFERLQGVLKASGGTASGASGGSNVFSVGEVSVYDLRLPLRLGGGAELAQLRGDLSAVSEPGPVRERYRLWTRFTEASGLRVEVAGRVDPLSGEVSLAPDVRIPRMERWLECATLVAPDQMARLTAFPSNCTFALRGAFSAAGWTNVGPFEVTAELGRGSLFSLKEPEGWVRFQTLRLEASGTPLDVQSRLSVGVSGFRIGSQDQVSQEEGRLLSMRGTARFRQTPTNRVVRATLDSDLPGRSVAQVLPKVLPLLPRMMTEGGTLHVEADVAQPLAGTMQGEVRYTAEARRSALTLPSGRVGAGRVAIEGVWRIEDAKPAALSTVIKVEEGYFFRPGLSVRGGAQMQLTSMPPYRTAEGVFEGRLAETAALTKSGWALQDGGLRFQGRASVEGLASHPVWHVSAEVPESGIASLRPGPSWRATVGAQAQIDYAPERVTLDGEVWARDATVSVASTGKVGLVEAGLERGTIRVRMADADPAALSNGVVQATLKARGGWCRAGEWITLEGGEAEVPFTWSLAESLRFTGVPRLTWGKLEAAGLQVHPGGLTLRTEGGRALAAFEATVQASRLRVAALASVPLDRPAEGVLEVSLPETVLAPDDAVVSVLRARAQGATFTGRVSADAKVRLLGTQPHALGRVRLADGCVRSGKMSVDGLAADIPFESSVFFRTIEKPWITFMSAKAGNVRLDEGRVTFQLTPQELFLDRMEVRWCKGSLNAYSVNVAFANPKDEFIVYADRVDLGEALMMVVPFKGKMEGVLYGRFPVGIDNGRVKLSTGFLYSLPGQGGKIRLDDSGQMRALLDRAGIKGEIQEPLSRALSDVDFSTFRLELEPQAGEAGMLRMKLLGKSNDKAWPAPVDLNLNLHAPLEELLNMGLDMSRK
jgi:hypothetical protein